MPRLSDVTYLTMADLGAHNASQEAVVYDCEQGTAEWFKSRCGIMTASKASLLIKANGTPAKSQSLETFKNLCVAETLAGSVEFGSSSGAAAERGTELEPHARRWYEAMRGVDVRQTGLIYRDDTMSSGASPDGVCEDRCVEIKCLSRANHIGAIRYCEENNKPPPSFFAQLQMQMWIMGLDRVDLVFYTPEEGIPCKYYNYWMHPLAQLNLDELVTQFAEDVANIARVIKGSE